MARPFPDPDKELEALRAFLEKGAETSLEVTETIKAAGSVSATSKDPGVVTFDVTASRLLEQLGDDDTRRVLLDFAIGNLTAPEGFYVNVFLNAKDATVDTPTEQAGYQTGFSFFCEPAQDVPEMACPIEPGQSTQTQFDITDTLKDIAGPDQPVTATLVIVPLDIQTTAEPALSIVEAELSIATSIVKIAS